MINFCDLKVKRLNGILGKNVIFWPKSEIIFIFLDFLTHRARFSIFSRSAAVGVGGVEGGGGGVRIHKFVSPQAFLSNVLEVILSE